jgi:hypothetical protein
MPDFAGICACLRSSVHHSEILMLFRKFVVHLDAFQCKKNKHKESAVTIKYGTAFFLMLGG